MRTPQPSSTRLTWASRRSSTQTVSGTRDTDGGCLFNGPAVAESGADEASLGAEEASFDPDTCEATFKVGPLSEGWGDSPPESSGVTVDDEGEVWGDGLREECRPWLPCDITLLSTDTTVTSSTSETWYPRKELYQSIAWEDPLQLDVNKSEVWLNFRSTEDCAGAGRYSHRARHYWLTETGWSRTHREGSFDGPFCTYLARETKARFVNSAFCDSITVPFGATTTRTRMWPNRVVGLPAGRHRPYREYSKAGDCSQFLHVELKYKVRLL